MRPLLVSILIVVTFIFSACSGPSTRNNLAKELPHNSDIDGGKILFYTTDGRFIDAANVGNLPDMVTFTPDGKTVLSANEGEPADDYSNDPRGSVSIVTLSDSQSNLVQNVTTLYFDDTNVPSAVCIKPGATPATDFEPEYIAINETGTKAWVSLQENNSLAIIDLAEREIISTTSLGSKDFQFIGINDKDGANVTPAPDNVYGLYQPDTIVSYSVDGKDYLISVNEGDEKEYEAWKNCGNAAKRYNERC